MSSTTASDSRSSSPATPETPELLDNLATSSVVEDIEASSWYGSVSAVDSNFWRHKSQRVHEVVKHEEDIKMLQLNELIQEHVYDECVYLTIASHALFV
jgi:hypothetical protein